MTRTRLSWLFVFVLFFASSHFGCSNDTGTPNAGTGGTAGTAGTAGVGGIIIGTGGTSGTAGTAGTSGTGGVIEERCGDGRLSILEACDDRNEVSGDGCAADCSMVEEGYRCPAPGVACVPIVCGDERIHTPETCEDGNDVGGDGCSAECQREEGWSCTKVGLPCVAAECGDGLRVGEEPCDDGNTNNGDGCSADCELEEGYKCPTEGEPCVPTVCGDGMIEGKEQCEDGNLTPFDGCNQHCKREPSCTGGSCDDVCGDGVILPGSTEACDDGNTNDGDGCSSTCTVEDGFECVLMDIALPDKLRIPVIYRDFRGYSATGNPLVTPSPTNVYPYGHVDFNYCGEGVPYTWPFQCGVAGGYGGTDIPQDFLDNQKKPVLRAGQTGIANGKPYSAASFSEWYRTSASPTATGNLAFVRDLVLQSVGNNVYRFRASPGRHRSAVTWARTSSTDSSRSIIWVERVPDERSALRTHAWGEHR
ncbi:MAG: DUF4215 domain-containing protein [Polyangiales bacterium]